MHVDGAPPVASLPRDVAIEAFYGRCTPEQADWAADRVRPQALAPFVTPVELGREERVAATRPPRAYVISAHDRAIPTCGVSIISSSRIQPDRELQPALDRRALTPTAATWCGPKVRHGDDELGGSLPRRTNSAVTKISSVRRLRTLQLVRHRLDPNADEWRQRVRLESLGNLARGGSRVNVFFRFRSMCRSHLRSRCGSLRPARLGACVTTRARSSRRARRLRRWRRRASAPRRAFLRPAHSASRTCERESPHAGPYPSETAAHRRRRCARLTPFESRLAMLAPRAVAAPESGGDRGECARLQRRGHARHRVDVRARRFSLVSRFRGYDPRYSCD